jgi:hypothetical protein
MSIPNERAPIKGKYSLSNIIRVIKLKRTRWVGNVARMRGDRNSFFIFVGNPGGKRSLGRPNRQGIS